MEEEIDFGLRRRMVDRVLAYLASLPSVPRNTVGDIQHVRCDGTGDSKKTLRNGFELRRKTFRIHLRSLFLSRSRKSGIHTARVPVSVVVSL